MKSMPTKAPATTGAFYYFNHPQAAQNTLQYLAPSPTTTTDIEPLFTPQIIPDISTHSKASHLYSPFLLIHLFPQRIYQILRSLSPSRMLLVLYQQGADELGGNQLSGEAEEGLGKGLVERGGYESGFVRKY